MRRLSDSMIAPVQKIALIYAERPSVALIHGAGGDRPRVDQTGHHADFLAPGEPGLLGGDGYTAPGGQVVGGGGTQNSPATGRIWISQLGNDAFVSVHVAMISGHCTTQYGNLVNW